MLSYLGAAELRERDAPFSFTRWCRACIAAVPERMIETAHSAWSAASERKRRRGMRGRRLARARHAKPSSRIISSALGGHVGVIRRYDHAVRRLDDRHGV